MDEMGVALWNRREATRCVFLFSFCRKIIFWFSVLCSILLFAFIEGEKSPEKKNNRKNYFFMSHNLSFHCMWLFFFGRLKFFFLSRFVVSHLIKIYFPFSLTFFSPFFFANGCVFYLVGIFPRWLYWKSNFSFFYLVIVFFLKFATEIFHRTFF